MRRGRWCAAVTVIALLTLAVGGSLVAAPAARAITYGKPVPSPTRSAPWALSVWWSPNASIAPEFICSATAIAAQEVVTAAHCVQRPGLTFVEVGASELGNGRRVAIEAAVRNPLYRDNRYTADIAVMRPLQPLGLRVYAHLGTATIDRQLRSSHPPAMGIFGWGEDETGAVDKQLHSMSLRIASSAARRYFGRVFSTRTMIAAGRYNASQRAWSGGCNGDSGGPLIVRSGTSVYLVGVTAFGGENCSADGPTVFTSVAAFAASVSAGRHSLPAVARTDNMALPEVVEAPRVTGALTSGSVLTCRPGRWTTNARAYTYRWQRGRVALGGGQHYAVRLTDGGQTVQCVVVASSSGGRRAATAVAYIPAA